MDKKLKYNNTTRTNCVLCGCDDIKNILTIKDMPVFMGVVENLENPIKNDLVIGECVECGLIQNTDLLDLDLVYMNNHNTAVVGDMWNKHYIKFLNYIEERSIGNIIFEIGDPSGKLAKNLSNKFDKWIIVEPNPDIENFDNVEIIKSFFDDDFLSNNNINNVKTIIHSHVLEHIYDPIDFLKKTHDLLEDGGCTIFSIPNIKWLLDNGSLPTSILHFEHTYYIDKDNINTILRNSGFELVDLYEFENHSLFVTAKKTNTKKVVISEKINTKNEFLDLVNIYKEKIDIINSNLDNRDFYLYSAHINSQYILNAGLNNNIISLLDNSPSKVGKYLYGYDYDVNFPNIIKDDKAPIIVASHMGVYFDEIKKDLLKINKNVIIL